MQVIGRKHTKSSFFFSPDVKIYVYNDVDVFKECILLKKALVWNVYLTQLWNIILLIQKINIFFRSIGIDIMLVYSCKQ